MSDMTWKEFKEVVDVALKEAGKDDTETINYIDISYPELGEGHKSVTVAVSIHGGIEVLN